MGKILIIKGADFSQVAVGKVTSHGTLVITITSAGSVTIVCEGAMNIYYTTDGNDPTGSYGELYSEPILLKDGTTFVAAVCKSKSGIFGQVTKQKYLISYSAPDAPLVTPDSGSYSMGNVISISTTPGTDIYYTWDNTDPTVNSSHYTEPIPMIEGNHVLSVIAYDPVHKMLSPVVRKNYVLNP